MSDRIGTSSQASVPVVAMKVENIHDVLTKSRSLPVRIQKNVLRKAVRAGTAILTKEARRRVPRRNTLLKRSLATKIKTYPHGVVGLVGQDPRRTIKNARDLARTKGGISGRGLAVPIHLVERPTESHTIRGRDPRESTELGAVPKTKALAFSFGGVKTFRWGVYHTGTKGTFFLQESQRTREHEVERAVEDKLLREIEVEAEKLPGAQASREIEEFFSGE